MVEKSKPHNQLMDNNNNNNDINNDDNNNNNDINNDDNNNNYYNSKRSSIDPILSPENVSESFQKKNIVNSGRDRFD